MAWQPQEDGLRQLCELLKDSLSGYDRARQKHAEETLLSLRQNPDYVNYLTYIFASLQLGQLGFQGTSLFTIRYSAAINLKNHVRSSYKTISDETLAYIKTSVLSTLQDTNPQLRSFAGTVITEIVQQAGLLRWPEVLQELIALVNNQSGTVPADTQEGAMSALAKVCEDNRRTLEKEFQGQRPMTVIVPKLFDFATHSDTRIRVLSLKTLKTFISQKSQTLFASLETYLNKVFQLANDTDIQVRRIVCQSIVELVRVKPDIIAPHMEGLVNFFLVQQTTVEGDATLALDAAEFWLNVGEEEKLIGLMGPYLQRVIPVLLAGMVYGEDDVYRLGGNEDNADVEDKEEDIKPVFAATKDARGLVQAQLINGTQTPPRNGASTPKDDLSDGEIDETDETDDFDDDDPENAWSLRKCSAAALDVFACYYHLLVFDIILPYLKENLQHQLWPKREAAVLALGAIAEGCIEVVAPHLPDLVPFLISLLNDEEPVVRQITCWCLGRYSEWASHLDSLDDKSRFFEPMMQGLLERMLDRNKKVQEAAASAFANLEEKAGNKLTPYTEPILRQFTQCFQRYKDRNMYIIYDCTQTLADNVGSELAKPQLVSLLMPVLIDRWNRTADSAREIFPLLACLGYVASAYGDAFSPFASPIFGRCIKIIYDTLQQHIAFMTQQTLDKPDKDFIVTSLDLLSAIIQAISPAESSHLVATSQPQFFDLLSFCMEDPSPDVRQSAFALLGDSAITIYEQLDPHLPKLIPLVTKQLDLDLIRDDDSDTGFNVLNNICWSCGEIGAKADPDELSSEQNRLVPFIDKLYGDLFVIITTEDCPDSVNENAAMAVGRLGMSCSEQLAPRLAEWAAPFLESMTKVDNFNDEKASAFLGLNKCVMRNPQGLGGEGVLSAYFTAIAGFPFKSKSKSGTDHEKLRTSFSNVIRGYRQLLGDGWDGFWQGQLSVVVRDKLAEGYKDAFV